MATEQRKRTLQFTAAALAVTAGVGIVVWRSRQRTRALSHRSDVSQSVPVDSTWEARRSAPITTATDADTSVPRLPAPTAKPGLSNGAQVEPNCSLVEQSAASSGGTDAAAAPSSRAPLPVDDAAARAKARSNLASMYSAVGTGLPPKRPIQPPTTQDSTPSAVSGFTAAAGAALRASQQPPAAAASTSASPPASNAAPSTAGSSVAARHVSDAEPDDDSLSTGSAELRAVAALPPAAYVDDTTLPRWQRLLAFNAAHGEDGGQDEAPPQASSSSREASTRLDKRAGGAQSSNGTGHAPLLASPDSQAAVSITRVPSGGLPPAYPARASTTDMSGPGSVLSRLNAILSKATGASAEASAVVAEHSGGSKRQSGPSVSNQASRLPGVSGDGVQSRSAEAAQPASPGSTAELRTSSGTPVRLPVRQASGSNRSGANLSEWPTGLSTATAFNTQKGGSKPGTPFKAPDGSTSSDSFSNSVPGVKLNATLPFSEWEVEGEHLEVCRNDDGTPVTLGQGSFGTVYKAMSHGVQPVAVKVFPMHATAQQHAEFQREVVLLKSCRDGNIVQFLGASQTDDQTLMILEYMENGDLFSSLRKDPIGELLWYRKDIKESGAPVPGLGRQIALDIARGLHFLHRHFVVHFDLKSPNILLGRNHIAKIADVGLAKILQKDYISSLQSVGTFAWSAPEILLGARCTEKVDIYGFGTILWELVTGESPARGRLRPIRVPDECPAAISELIAACMDHKPANRPSAKDIVVVLSEQGRSLERLRSSRAPGSATHSGSKSADSDCSDELVQAIVDLAHIIGGPASGITNEEAVEAARFRDSMKIQKAYIRELRRCLASETVSDPLSGAHQRLLKLVEAQRAVMMLFMQERSKANRRFQFLSAPDPPAGERGGGRSKGAQAPQIEWQQLLDDMELTQEQMVSMVTARSVVTARMKRIADDRKRLMAALHSFVLEAPGAAGFTSAVEQSDALKSNLEAEGALLQDFHIVFTCKTLHPVQQARLEVACFPRLPDALTVCNLVAARLAGPPAEAAAGASRADEVARATAAASRRQRGTGDSLRAISV